MKQTLMVSIISYSINQVVLMDYDIIIIWYLLHSELLLLIFLILDYVIMVIHFNKQIIDKRKYFIKVRVTSIDIIFFL